MWPVLALIGGFSLNWLKDAVSESRAARRAKRDAFELLQRETYLELQDALPAVWRASIHVVSMARSESESDTATFLAAVDEFRGRYMRAKALATRIADHDVQHPVSVDL